MMLIEIPEKFLQKKAVEAKVAYYDSKTKEFKFIDVKDK